MTTNLRIGRAALICSLLGSTAAFADVTAQDVWADWQTNMSLYGDGVTTTVGSETQDGGTLTVSDIVMTFTDPEATVTVNLGDMVFAEQGDGTVSVSVAETVPMTVNVTPEYGDPATINISLVQSGVDLVVGGTPEQMNYALTADSYTIQIDSVEGDTDDVVFNEARLTMSQITGAYSVAGGALRNIDYDISAGDIGVVFDIVEDGGPGMMKLNGAIAGLDASAVVAIPEDMDPEMPEMAFADGLSVDIDYTVGASDFSFEFLERNDQMQGTAQAQSGRVSLAMDKDGFSYSGGAVAPRVAFSGSEVPFPVEVAMSEYSYGATVPLSASEEPRDFGLQLLLSDLAVNDAIWGMIDPGGILSHDPATLAVDLSGMARLFVDVMNPDGMESVMMSGDVPGELHALNLNDLRLAVAGAALTGTGAFTFDNTDLATFGGFPAPRGTANFTLNGANQLIDKLVEMGLLPQEQVMGARMMMGMFMTAVGDDQLESTVEVNDQNHVIVNGQRLQ